MKITWNEFNGIMTYFQAMYGVEKKGRVIDIYWRHLKHLSKEQLELSCQNLIKEFIPTAAAPFPLVAHILKYCGESINDKANNAIAMLKRAVWKVGSYQTVDFLDPALNLAVMSFGGWPSICNWSSKEWDVNEGRLKENYMSFQRKGSGRIDHLPGTHEMQGGFFTLYIAKSNDKMIVFKKYDDPEQLAMDQDFKDRKIAYYQNVDKQYLLPRDMAGEINKKMIK